MSLCVVKHVTTPKLQSPVQQSNVGYGDCNFLKLVSSNYHEMWALRDSLIWGPGCCWDTHFTSLIKHTVGTCVQGIKYLTKAACARNATWNFAHLFKLQWEKSTLLLYQNIISSMWGTCVRFWQLLMEKMLAHIHYPLGSLNLQVGMIFAVKLGNKNNIMERIMNLHASVFHNLLFMFYSPLPCITNHCL